MIPDPATETSPLRDAIGRALACALALIVIGLAVKAVLQVMP